MPNQKQNPYPNRNFTSIADYLEELVLIASKEKGLLPIRDESNGFQDITLPEDSVYALTIPPLAVSATIMVESNSVVSGIVMRFKENGGAPSNHSGFGLCHNDIYELSGRCNLHTFRAIALEGQQVTLRVQYYTTAQQISAHELMNQLELIDRKCLTQIRE
ncbi:MAG: hypothetical protein ABJQ69_03500 [Ekhidna sp.]